MMQFLNALNALTIALQTSAVSFQGEKIVSSPQQESWIFLVLFGLFMIFVFSVNQSYGWIVDSLRNFTKTNIRNSIFSETTTRGYQTRLVFPFFSVGVLTLYIYIRFFPEVELQFSVFALLLLVGNVFLLLKYFFSKILAYTFLNRELFTNSSEFYINILFFLGLVIYPLLVIKIYSPQDFDFALYDILALIFSLISLMFLIIKLFQLFYKNILDAIHIMLYLCTLEILPYLVLFQAYKWIIKEF